MRLTENIVKSWLRDLRFPVPDGAKASSSDSAAAVFERMSGAGAVVKALVPTGRRGKAGAVRKVATAQECMATTAQLLGTRVHDHLVCEVYVEEFIVIREEYYLSFSINGPRPAVLITRRGGVDIEDAFQQAPDAIVRTEINPLRSMTSRVAMDLWLRAGVRDALLPVLGTLTADLYAAFQAGDATLLEINPLAVDVQGKVSLVGAMMAVDANALYRHPEWAQAGGEQAHPENEREKSVVLANRSLPGGECQYVELDGDIGLLVGGGGAGLYQHDLMLEAGGRPANHCVTPPTGSDNRKLKAVLRAILENPRVRGMLVGFNFAQMARTDIRVRSLLEMLDEKHIDTARFPIVIRLFGAGEEESRAMAAGRPNIYYVPRGTTLKQAVRLIVDLVGHQGQGALP